MKSILPKENFVLCRNCASTISSARSACDKCGIPYSGDGIDELVEIEDRNIDALNEALRLRIGSILFVISLVPSFYIDRAYPATRLFILEILLLFTVIFVLHLVAWNQYHLRPILEDEIHWKALAIRSQALWTMVIAFLVVLLYVIFSPWNY